MYKPKKLVYVEKFDSQVKAMKRERKIKHLSHRQKLELVKSQINASDYRTLKVDLHPNLKTSKTP
jgi:predicted GIY-YIG superfamily endonuclease